MNNKKSVRKTVMWLALLATVGVCLHGYWLLRTGQAVDDARQAGAGALALLLGIVWLGIVNFAVLLPRFAVGLALLTIGAYAWLAWASGYAGLWLWSVFALVITVLLALNRKDK